MSLLDLPPEVLTQITNSLDTVDLLDLRLTSSILTRVSLHEFGTRCFGRRRFMISRLSLETLAELAENKNLGSFLHTLVVGIDYLTKNMLDDSDWGLGPESQRKRAAYQAYTDEQEDLRISGRATALLTKALQALRNCRNVYLHAGEDGELQPERQLGLNSFGAATIERDTGKWPASNPRPNEAAELIGMPCQIVFDAITASGVVLDSFEVEFQSRSTAVPITTFCLSPTRIQHLQAFTSNLKRLKLHASFDHEGVDLPCNWATWSASFILLFSKLEDLDFTAEALDDSARFMEALASKSTGIVKLPKLKSLALRQFLTTADDIVGFLGGCPKLEAFSIHGTSLYEGSWVEVLQYLLGSSPALSRFEFGNNWARVLNKGCETHKKFLLKERDTSISDANQSSWCADGKDVVRALLRTVINKHF
ncbi:MAG: hypothetical protein M1821_009383 [Bathelium mastoideum]|nr:MAG: hypothetical protein M1821_009383 [Bathelium mastoideum]